MLHGKIRGRSWVLALCLLAKAPVFAQGRDPQPRLEEAARAFEKGRMAEAEADVRLVLQKHPSDLRALLLMGAILDSQRRYPDAEAYYRRGLAIAPGSVQLLNNVANHYTAAGNRSKAREFYLKAVAIDPRHPNANLQLARMSVEEKQGMPAMMYLDRVGSDAGAGPVILELRARALSLVGRCSEAGELARRLEAADARDWRLPFSAGAVYSACKLYARAEAAFSRALDADPRNFDILYNLGLAALNAGHDERAAGVFEAALSAHPEDPDCLYALAQAYLRQSRAVDAAALLAKAVKLAPRREGALLQLAQVSAQLEFYQDSAATYERYLQLRPGDELARREHAFALANTGQFRKGLPELEDYARRHPRDAQGLYELAVAQAFEDRDRAVQSLDRALALDGRLRHARYTRAMLHLERGKSADAIQDLRLLLRDEPRNPRVLGRLGQAYLALDRLDEAQPLLKEAVQQAPDVPWITKIYCSALRKAGADQEAAALEARINSSGTAAEDARTRAGLIAYLSLPAAEQRERYLAGLRKNAGYDPDFRWRTKLGRELFADGKNAEALKIFDEIRSATRDPEILGRCGTLLMEMEQYQAARPFLEAAVAGTPPFIHLRLELANVLFHLEGASSALRELDANPEPQRNGDYYLLRAQLLDSLGRVPEAAEALDRGLRAAPTRPSLYFQAASFLLKHRLHQEALDLLEKAGRLLPDARELLVARSVALILLHRENDAAQLLAAIQARWPEWDRPYLLKGIFLQIQLRPAEAKKALETAIALGANSPEAYYYQALALMQADPPDLKSAEQAITRALALTSNDPYVYLAAGKISLAHKEYSKTVGYLLEATRLDPGLIPARYGLRSAYKALGEEQKAAAELEQIKRLGKEKEAPEQNPLAIEEFLFTVRPPF